MSNYHHSHLFCLDRNHGVKISCGTEGRRPRLDIDTITIHLNRGQLEELHECLGNYLTESVPNLCPGCREPAVPGQKTCGRYACVEAYATLPESIDDVIARQARERKEGKPCTTSSPVTTELTKDSKRHFHPFNCDCSDCKAYWSARHQGTQAERPTTTPASATPMSIGP